MQVGCVPTEEALLLKLHAREDHACSSTCLVPSPEEDTSYIVRMNDQQITSQSPQKLQAHQFPHILLPPSMYMAMHACTHMNQNGLSRIKKCVCSINSMAAILNVY